MKALDLFCGSGGAGKGLNEAGFEVLGIDMNDQEFYPFEYLKCDVFDLPKDFFEQFDLIWASPPCQAYSFGTKWVRNTGKEYPDLVQKTRDLLNSTGKPYVIENVPGAPIRKDLVLCGEMFGLNVIRHRHFEIKGFHVPQIKHKKHTGSVCKGERIGVWMGGKPGCFGNRKKYYTVAGHWNGTIEQWKDAMGINWVNKKPKLAQCVPPSYSKYIGEHYKI